jgi:hypothetical protein
MPATRSRNGKTTSDVPATARIDRRGRNILGGKMRIGSLLNVRTVVLGIAAAALVAAKPASSLAQSQYGSYAANSRPTQALYTPQGNYGGGRQAAYDSYGNPAVVPAGFCQGCGGQGCGNCVGNSGCGGCDCYGCGYGGGCYSGGGCYGGGGGRYGDGCGGYPGCAPMGCGGTDPPIGYDLMNDVGMAGNPCDQRGPHYFDFRVEAVLLSRDETFSDQIDFTSLNVGNNVVLSSNQLDFDERAGFRAIGRYDIGALSVFEFGYTGVFDWNTSARVDDPGGAPGNLFSLFSRPAPGQGQFGVNPATVTLPSPLNPFPETEQALSHSISLDSDLQSAELLYRRYWLGYIPRISGTLIAGFRYTRLDENFVFESQGSQPAVNNPLGPLAALRYDSDCENNLAGFQTGGDIWISLTQGLRIGAETKLGLYNNHYSLSNRITTTPIGTTPPTLTEEINDDKPAFLAETSFDIVFDILPSLSLRTGYEVLFMDSLVLAGENFNQTSPYGNQGPRVPFVNDNGEAFYSGVHAGIEYIW